MSALQNLKADIPAQDYVHSQVLLKQPILEPVREKSKEELDDEFQFARINRVLKQKLGRDYKLERFYGEEIRGISKSKWAEIASCYKQIFNESWGESWTDESALSEIKKMLDWKSERLPLLVLLYHNKKVIGFSMGQVMDSSHLCLDEDMSSALSLKKKCEGMEVMNYWLNEVVEKQKFLFFRELGVLKDFQHEVSPFLGLPIINKARNLSCDVVFCRVNTKSKAFKWHLGVGFSPIHFFIKNNLLLMLGSAKYASKVLDNMIRKSLNRESHLELIGNINRYLCR